jgi:hypothetical protein
MTTRRFARSFALGWLAACVVAMLGCDPPPTEIPPGEAQSASTAPPPVSPPPTRPRPPSEPVVEPADAGAPAAESPPAAGTGTPAPAPVPALAAVGGKCDTAADCQSGICEGEGCGPKGGRCVAKGRVCTRDRRAYCGCDGNTFHSSGSCPGARFSSRSMCTGGGGGGGGGGAGGGGGGAAKLAADGAACKAAGDCQSGICEGEGCGAASSGVCMSRKRPCTADLRAFCGCDGATFKSSTSCPGRRYASRGDCKK